MLTQRFNLVDGFDEVQDEVGKNERSSGRRASVLTVLTASELLRPQLKRSPSDVCSAEDQRGNA